MLLHNVGANKGIHACSYAQWGLFKKGLPFVPHGGNVKVYDEIAKGNLKLLIDKPMLMDIDYDWQDNDADQENPAELVQDVASVADDDEIDPELMIALEILLQQDEDELEE